MDLMIESLVVTCNVVVGVVCTTFSFWPCLDGEVWMVRGVVEERVRRTEDTKEREGENLLRSLAAVPRFKNKKRPTVVQLRERRTRRGKLPLMPK